MCICKKCVYITYLGVTHYKKYACAYPARRNRFLTTISLSESVLFCLDAKAKDARSLLMEFLETTKPRRNIVNISAYEHVPPRSLLVPSREQTKRSLCFFVYPVFETVCLHDEFSLNERWKRTVLQILYLTLVRRFVRLYTR